MTQKRGIDFQISTEIGAELRGVGAGEELLMTLRALAPKTAMLLIQ